MKRKKASAEDLCEVKTEYCRGKATLTARGIKKSDPVFRTCMACYAMLKRKGVKMKLGAGKPL
jgi:hypothetical protein